uniref:Uncharacterized protein n=1 Tax=uncultured Chloroflexi bacterium HF0200_09I09 TaxID=710736 RepID=E0XU70_9CHLR|nr:hypothetical protein [uncultured Chloroflexi bacterium HF0200_09I09]
MRLRIPLPLPLPSDVASTARAALAFCFSSGAVYSLLARPMGRILMVLVVRARWNHPFSFRTRK